MADIRRPKDIIAEQAMQDFLECNPGPDGINAFAKLIGYHGSIVTEQLMDDMTRTIQETNLEHERQMVALWARTSRYRRQRNTLAITIGVIAWQSYRNYKADMKKPLDRD